jgi:hypothetical protein
MGTAGPSAATLSFGGGGSAARSGFGPGRSSGLGGGFSPGGGFGAGSRSGTAGRPAGGAAAGGGNGLWAGNGTLTTAQQDLLDYVQQHRDGARYVLTLTNVEEAATYVLRANADVLSVGGFGGQVPSPTLTQFENYVASGQVRYIYLTTTFGGSAGLAGAGQTKTSQTGKTSQTAESQIAAWVPAHCSKVPASDYGGTATSSTSGTLYQCTGSLQSDGLREGAATDRSGPIAANATHTAAISTATQRTG